MIYKINGFEVNRPKRNQCVLFRNLKKRRAKHPDYIGFIDVKGELSEIKLYIRKTPQAHAFLLGGISGIYEKKKAKKEDIQEEVIIEVSHEYKQGDYGKEGKAPF